MALAAKQNPELQAAQARTSAQLERALSVKRMRLPRLGVSVGWSRTDMPAAVFANKLNSGQFTPADFDVARINDPGALNHLGTTIAMEAPIDVFGKIGTMAGAMAAYGEAASAGVQDATLEIRMRVVDAYRQLELAGRAVALTERVLAVAKAREAELESRVSAGGALNADLLRARSRRRQREADVAERKGQQRMAAAGLARLLGAPADTTYVATDPPPPVQPLTEPEATWTTRALGRRPLLVAVQKKAAAANALVRSEKRSWLPDLGVSGQLFDNRIGTNDGSQAWAFGVGLRWQAFDGSRSKRQATAVAEERAAQADLRAAADQVRLEVALAHGRAVTARERHAAAAGGAEEGREAFRVVQERRKAGMATLTDELETETAALGAALEEIGAAAEVAMADAALGRAAGEI
jgi:outer membrane protein TolC